MLTSELWCERFSRGPIHGSPFHPPSDHRRMQRRRLKRITSCMSYACSLHPVWVGFWSRGQRRGRVLFLDRSSAIWWATEGRDPVASTTRYIDRLSGLSGLSGLREEREAGRSNQGFLCPVDRRRNRPATILEFSFPPHLTRPSRWGWRWRLRGRKTRGFPSSSFENWCSRAAGYLELLRRRCWRRGLGRGIRVHERGTVAGGHT